MSNRRGAREAAIQLAFMCEFFDNWSEEHIDGNMSHFSVKKSSRPYAKTILRGIYENLASIDSLITCASLNWSLSRMSRVDRAIIRVATFEILNIREIPISVIINEAIEIAKDFGSDSTIPFINGVLDRISRSAKARPSFSTSSHIEMKA